MSLSVEEMWEYWADPNTRDLIENAEPLDKILGIGGDGRKEEPHDDVRPLGGGVDGGVDTGRVKTVDDDKLTTYPYQSVGRLFWCKPPNRSLNRSHIPPITWVTAFYIGNNKIMTAAHAFDDEQRKNKFGVFVPAMINTDDIYGKNYGCFLVDPKLHKRPTSYVPYKTGEDNTFQYDICTVELGKTCFKEHQILNMYIGDANLQPIPYVGDREPTRDTTWIVLGYPFDNGKQTQVKGKYYEEQNNDQVAINIELREGMSGGPWILGDKIGDDARANGCLAGASSYRSVSPYFSSDLFDILGLDASN